MRRVFADVARSARGASASSSARCRADAFPSLALARLGFATRVSPATNARGRLLPLLGAVSEHPTPTRRIATSAASEAPRSTKQKATDGAASKKQAADLEAFIQACCADIDRGDDRDAARSVVAALRAVGRDTVPRLDDFGESNAMAAGVPSRLAVAIRRRIAGNAVMFDRAMRVETSPGVPVEKTLEGIPTFEEEDADASNDANRDSWDVTDVRSKETTDRRFLVPKVKGEGPASTRSTSRASEGRMPRSMRPDPSRGNVASTRVTRRLEHVLKASSRIRASAASSSDSARGVLGSYRVRDSEISESLKLEFIKFRRFLTARRLGSREAPIKEVTAKKYEDQIRGLLGWMRLAYPEDFSDGKSPVTSMKVAFPNASRASARHAFEHLQWLSETRKCGPAYELVALRSFIAAAKFLHGDEDSETDSDAETRPYANVPLVSQLRKLNKDTGRRASKARPTSDVKKKWLSWDAYARVVRLLEDEVAPRWSSGGVRSERAVAWSLQRYLIFGILSCVPDRQRTIRELEIDRTLFKERVREDDAGDAGDGDPAVSKNGADDPVADDAAAAAPATAALDPRASRAAYPYRWVIKHGPEDYKTGGNYGERPPMVISPTYYSALEEWITRRRSQLRPSHNFLFTARNGNPLTDVGVHRVMTSTSYRLTGQRVNPHLIRDMIITHLRGTDASERQLEALAIYMGHSLATQKGTYDRRSQAEKVAPAVELLTELNAGTRGEPGGFKNAARASSF